MLIDASLKKGHQLGLVDDDSFARFQEKMHQIEDGKRWCRTTWLSSNKESKARFQQSGVYNRSKINPR